MLIVALICLYVIGFSLCKIAKISDKKITELFKERFKNEDD